VSGVGTSPNKLEKLRPKRETVAVVISVLALGVSVFSIYLTTKPPEVLLQMPKKVRVMQATRNNEAEVYLQPSFINTGQNARGEVIDNIKLSVTYLPAGESEERKYVWFGTESYGEWDFTKEEYDLEYFHEGSYSIISDPEPLVLSPATTEAPVVFFEAERTFRFEPGTYQLTISASRASKSEADLLRKTINIELDQGYIDLLNAQGDRGEIGQVVPASPSSSD
jgi:hypothetical protein